MALLGWWPFNGDLEDYTVYGNNMTNSGSTFVTTGKIGDALEINSGAFGIDHVYVNDFHLNKIITNVSMSVWTYITIENSLSTIIQIEASNKANLLALQIDSSGFNMQYNTIYPLFSYDFTPHLNNWVNIIVTRSPDEIRYYVNGQYLGNDTTTDTGTTLNFGPDNRLCIGVEQDGIGGGINSAQSFSGYLNDVRIYDHILSQREINEINQAKILHYTFNEPYELTPTSNEWINGELNHDTNGENWVYPGTGTVAIISDWIYGAYPTTGTIDPGINITWYNSGGYNNKPRLVLEVFSSDNSENNIYSSSNGTISLKPGEYIEFTGWFKCNLAGTAHFNIHATRISDSASVWLHSPYHSGNGDWEFIRYIVDGDMYTDINVFRCQGLESHADFVMEISDIQYKIKNYNPINDLQVYDNSGLKNHSTDVHSTFTYRSSESVAGTGSLFFNGVEGYLDGPSSILREANNFTVSAWVKLRTHSSNTNIGQCIVTNYGPGGWIFYLDGPDSRIGLRNHTLTPSTAYSIEAGSSDALTLNTWYHVAVTDDGTTVTLYVNGISVKTGTSVISDLFSNNIKIGYFSDLNDVFDGYIDDVRVYSQPLTADEIWDLYATRGKVDNEGNIYTGEFIEDFRISPELTARDLLVTNNLHPYQDNIGSVTSDSSGTQFLYNITNGNMYLSWNYSTNYYVFQNGRTYYTYIELEEDSQNVSEGYINLSDSSRPGRWSGSATTIYAGQPHSVIFSNSYDNYNISLVEGPVGEIKMKYWIVIDLTEYFGDQYPTKEELDKWVRDTYRTRVDYNSKIFTEYIEEDYIENYEAVSGITLTNIFEDNQLTQNFDFSLDGDSNGVADSWTVNSGTSAQFDIIEFDNRLWQRGVNDGSIQWLRQSFSYNTNDIYYINFDFQKNTTNTNVNPRIVFRESDNTWVASYSATVDNNKLNQKQHISHIVSSGNALATQFWFDILINSGNDGDEAMYSYVRVYNLTSIFGSGSEPTASQMDIWFNDYMNYRYRKTKIYEHDIKIQGQIQEG